jgi:dihydropteroate synthase
MGIVNVTPDSFYDGGRFDSPDRALDRARALVEEGADILDIGGESTRPGSAGVSIEEERDRIAAVVDALARELETPISVDTSKPEVADECLRLGAVVVNDVTGLRDPAMIETAARHGAGVVIMHMRGKPRSMQLDIRYDDVVREVGEFLKRQAEEASAAGISPVLIDPGIGFGKTAAHNFEILGRLEELTGLEFPLLIGPSRKSFLGSLAGKLPLEQRLEGTLGAICAAALKGARVVRVHDVRAAKRALEVVDEIRKYER